MDDKELERRAIEAILKNIAKVPEKTLKAATRFIPPSSQNHSKVIPNKQFLGTTIKSVLSHNERVERQEQENSSKALKNHDRNKTMERFKGRPRTRSRSRSRSRTSHRSRDKRYERRKKRSMSRSPSRTRRRYDYNDCDIEDDWRYGTTPATVIPNPSHDILRNPEVNMMFSKYFCEFISSCSKPEPEIATIDLTKRGQHKKKRKTKRKKKRKKSLKKRKKKKHSSSSSNSSSSSSSSESSSETE